PEEQDEYHVDDEVRGARRYVRTGREGSSSGGEEWRNPKDLAGLEAEYVSKDEAEDGDADSQHQHQLCAVDEYLADLEDLGLLPRRTLKRAHCKFSTNPPQPPWQNGQEPRLEAEQLPQSRPTLRAPSSSDRVSQIRLPGS